MALLIDGSPPVDVISYNPPKKVLVDGNLEVKGDILVIGGKCLMTHIEDANKQLIHENQELKKRVEQLERMVNMLWYAPGMPGYEESKNDFYLQNKNM
jgi:hypothetical protein